MTLKPGRWLPPTIVGSPPHGHMERH
jgi:hypothetical protein